VAAESAADREPADWLFPDWPAPAHVRAAVTLRTSPGVSMPPFDRCNLGTRCGDVPAAVAANRAGLIGSLGLPSAPLWLRQVHGIGVLDADAAGDDESEVDAAVSRSTESVLAVLTADCLPVLFSSEDGATIGVAHAGWRGLSAGVLEATVAALDVPPSTLMAWLGPAIGPDSYEVGDEVRAAFISKDPGAASAFRSTRPGHWLCDLYALAHQRLAAAGVMSVYGGGLDTFTDPRFYSYRRDRETGRFASLIWIDANASVFARHLGEAFATLPARVRDLHRANGHHRYRGVATVVRGHGVLSRLFGWATSLPPSTAQTPIEVDIAADADTETWTRRFGAHSMRSRLWLDDALLRERLGLVTFGFALSASGGVLRWHVREARVFGIPLPARWFCGVRALESEADGRYRFEVEASFPLAGELVRYEGWLAAADD